MKKLLFVIILTLAVYAYAQETFPVNGSLDKRETVYAFTNATLVQDYQTVLKKATLLIKGKMIIASGKKVNIPKEAVIFNLKGKYIYPSFIDLYTDYGLTGLKQDKYKKERRPYMESATKGAYNWNEAIKANFNAAEYFTGNKKIAKEHRKQGFGIVQTHRQDGIIRGTASLVLLSDDKPHNEIIKSQSALHLSFKKGSSMQDYPSSQMGAIALIRQTYLDAKWYSSLSKKPFKDLSLVALNRSLNLPQIFDVSNKLEVLRAAKIGKEFGIKYIIKGSGDEYQRLEEMKQTNLSIILPISFPKAVDVEDVYDTEHITLEEMKHWELAPLNPLLLAKENIAFAFTASGLREDENFLCNLREIVRYGLDEKEALKALTHTPAGIIGEENQIGSLKNGMMANFLITSDNIFNKKAVIYENWVAGKRFVVAKDFVSGYEGKYSLRVNNESYSLEIKNKQGKPDFKVLKNKEKYKTQGSIENGLVTISFTNNNKESTRLSGWINHPTFKGKAELPDGSVSSWVAQYQKPLEKKETKKKKEELPTHDLGDIIYPFTAYGNKNIPARQSILIKNATIWTNEAQGILENTDVFIKDGKISQVGKKLKFRAAVTIDATGKHLTSGIIDEHSHIAISKGVNEGTHAVSAEVRIGDVIDSEDINLYRHLSGGVSHLHLLHGSANPIGGQTALIKLRWGSTPENLKVKGAVGFIKFALGENVKQSNWGDNFNKRFPQTRMGVEQVYNDAFTSAKEYAAERTEKGNLARKNLQLEALNEILNKKRFITCHSYMQHEINMLIKLAEKFGFKVNTFTHILEGYKVADKMHKHGVGGSSFSDWFAYKFEVKDAIPYNVALMSEQKVLSAINSDDAEMGRRLNQEAAKAVKYGGLSEEEAWKTVTLNPAKLLHIDHRSGSIKVGKDADVVLWSDNPLSIYAKAEKTIVDGVIYFDREKDKQMRESIKKERARLIQKMKLAKALGKPTRKATPKKTILWECGSLYSIE